MKLAVNFEAKPMSAFCTEEDRYRDACLVSELDMDKELIYLFASIRDAIEQKESQAKAAHKSVMSAFKLPSTET